MKSQDEWPDSAITYVKKRIEDFANSPLTEANYYDSFLQLILINERVVLDDDILPSLVVKSENSKLAFNSLKRIAAHFELHRKDKPQILSSWLIDYLRGNRKEPKFGRTGPNKSQIEQSFLLGLSVTVSEKFNKPIWPRETQDEFGCVLAIIALASKDLKTAKKKHLFPITTSAMEKRYVAARSLLKANNK